jgi:hypothetical protein
MDVRLPSIAHAWPMRSTLFNNVGITVMFWTAHG